MAMKKAFFSCIKEKPNNVEKMTKLLEKGLNPNFYDESTGETPFTLAVVEKLPKEIFKILVEGGSHMDFRNKAGFTPLHIAATIGNKDAMQTLLDFGASPNTRDAKGFTPLYLCVSSENTDVRSHCVELLLKEKTIIGFRNRTGMTEVHQACVHGRVQHLRHLLTYGADINSKTAEGNTPLHLCVLHDKEECAIYLLNHGADKNLKNFSDQSPTALAVASRKPSLAELISNFQPESVAKVSTQPQYNPNRIDFTLKIKQEKQPRQAVLLKGRDLPQPPCQDSINHRERKDSKLRSFGSSSGLQTYEDHHKNEHSSDSEVSDEYEMLPYDEWSDVSDWSYLNPDEDISQMASRLGSDYLHIIPEKYPSGNFRGSQKPPIVRLDPGNSSGVINQPTYGASSSSASSSGGSSRTSSSDVGKYASIRGRKSLQDRIEQMESQFESIYFEISRERQLWSEERTRLEERNLEVDSLYQSSARSDERLLWKMEKETLEKSIHDRDAQLKAVHEEMNKERALWVQERQQLKQRNLEIQKEYTTTSEMDEEHAKWRQERAELEKRMSDIDAKWNLVLKKAKPEEGEKYKISAVSCRFTKTFSFPPSAVVYGVTKVGTRLYAICGVDGTPTFNDNLDDHLLLIFEDQNPFSPKESINIKGIQCPNDMSSCNKSNCLYVTDEKEKCIWKIATNNYHTTKWLCSIERPFTLSVTTNGHLLALRDGQQNSRSMLEMYNGSDATVILRLPLSYDIVSPLHAIQDQSGRFVISHRLRDGRWVISQVAIDGQVTVQYKPNPGSTSQELNFPCHLSLDSENGRLFVSDCGFGVSRDRMILLDSNTLRWIRHLGSGEAGTKLTSRLFYDTKSKELIALHPGGKVNAYSINN